MWEYPNWVCGGQLEPVPGCSWEREGKCSTGLLCQSGCVAEDSTEMSMCGSLVAIGKAGRNQSRLKSQRLLLSPLSSPFFSLCFRFIQRLSLKRVAEQPKKTTRLTWRTIGICMRWSEVAPPPPSLPPLQRRLPTRLIRIRRFSSLRIFHRLWILLRRGVISRSCMNFTGLSSLNLPLFPLKPVHLSLFFLLSSSRKIFTMAKLSYGVKSSSRRRSLSSPLL